MSQTSVPMLVIVILGVLGAFSTFNCVFKQNTEANIPKEVVTMFEEWKNIFNKKYETPEENSYRMGVFHANYRIVKDQQPELTYKIGLNLFADLSSDEFKSKYLGLRFTDAPRKEVPINNLEENPKYIDWRDQGIVNEVKNQQQCGSCWAFSAVASMEGKWAQVKNELLSLSEQQLVDCSQSYGNMGCKGGWMDYAFAYAKDKGMTTETDYPYTGVDGKCAYNGNGTVQITGFNDVPANNGQSLEDAATLGVVSVGVDAILWQLYINGVFTNKLCGVSLDHGVAVVGYGFDKTEQFWIVRNSWTQFWGEGGYIRVLKTLNAGFGECGINMKPSYPTISN